MISLSNSLLSNMSSRVYHLAIRYPTWVSKSLSYLNQLLGDPLPYLGFQTPWLLEPAIWWSIALLGFPNPLAAWTSHSVIRHPTWISKLLGYLTIGHSTICCLTQIFEPLHHLTTSYLVIRHPTWVSKSLNNLITSYSMIYYPIWVFKPLNYLTINPT